MWSLGKGLPGAKGLFGGDGHAHELGEAPDLAGLAETIGKSINAAAVFGPPVNRGRTTVIPVAKARYGLGGGRMPWSRGGSGAGGSMQLSPTGYLLLRGGTARYRPIAGRSWPTLTLGLVVLAALGALLPFVLSENGFRDVFPKANPHFP